MDGSDNCDSVVPDKQTSMIDRFGENIGQWASVVNPARTVNLSFIIVDRIAWLNVSIAGRIVWRSVIIVGRIAWLNVIIVGRIAPSSKQATIGKS
ncbi:hypothetical protein BaRGS_00007311 [Batillaria attramentaria]|uniref:Uncharacterized protein n=1 Tax=Batillaria attramentaria TaxID=370345 RepID=A0ABD0LR79_9CAEN